MKKKSLLKMSEHKNSVSIIENTDQKLVLKIDLSTWKLKKLCPHCHCTTIKTNKLRKYQPIKDQKKEYDTYVQIATKTFGINSLPLCLNCWNNLEHYDKCNMCNVPLCVKFGDDELDFGNAVLSYTTVFERDDINGDFCISCSATL